MKSGTGIKAVGKNRVQVTKYYEEYKEKPVLSGPASLDLVLEFLNNGV